MRESGKVLFATDYSQPSMRALPWATVVARGLNAPLLIVHVDERFPAYRLGSGYSGVSEPGIEPLVKELLAVVPDDPRVACEHQLLMGDPAGEIVSLARDESVQAIIVGSRGRSNLAKILVGSVASAVVRDAPCPVIVVRTDTHKELSHVSDDCGST